MGERFRPRRHASRQRATAPGHKRDVDGDQLVNIMDYGISTDLNVMNTGPEPTTLTDSYGGVHSVIPPVRVPRRADVTPVVEGSGVRFDWVSVASSTGGSPFTGGTAVANSREEAGAGRWRTGNFRAPTSERSTP